MNAIRALVVYCHPDPASFSAAVRDQVLSDLKVAGAETRLHDLYADGFDPVLRCAELAAYLDTQRNRAGLEQYVGDLTWCNTLIFIYPTWWHGMPAMLKGWLDRVLLPGVAFHLPDNAAPVRPALVGVTRLAVFTTGGATRLLTALVGSPGRRMLMRGVRAILSPRCRRCFAICYNIDRSTPAIRAAHLARVRRALSRLLG